MILLSLAAAWVAGIVVASLLQIPPVAVGLFTLAAVLLLAFLATERRTLLPGIVLLVLVAGMWRIGLGGPDAGSELARYHGRAQVLVEGTVTGDPERAGSSTQLRLSVDTLTREGERLAVSGLVLVTLRPTPEIAALRDLPHFRYGDRIELSGVLEAPPRLADFDYPAYLARQGIDTVMSFPDVRLLAEGVGNPFYQWLYGVRHRMADSLGRVMREPQAAMGKALLLGLRDDLPDEQVDSFRRTGTSHILAISGLHVGILLGLTLATGVLVFGRRHHLYLLMPAVAVWLYALISGMSPSVTRAAIMGSVYLAALLVGRPRSVLPALGFAAALMVAVDPEILWSVSFQLSFTAVAGIAVLAPSLTDWARDRFGSNSHGRGWTGSLTQGVALAVIVSGAATVATLPLVAFNFQQVPTLGIPATVLALPALPFVLGTSLVAVVATFVHPSLGEVLGWIAWVPISYLTWVVQLFALVPESVIAVPKFSGLLVWTYYGVFAVVILAPKRFRLLIRRTGAGRVQSIGSGLRVTNFKVLAPGLALSIFAAVAWSQARTSHDGRLPVLFLDVG
ncbi:MAG: ComEC family competence protein, partial [Chloroflexi bacterium]|nr:ComEC family competence protein [Chloroflexota bacterium]